MHSSRNVYGTPSSMRAGFAVSVALLGLLAIAACKEDEVEPPRSFIVDQPPCPSTLADAIDDSKNACAKEGQLCTTPYPCGAYPIQTARCTCTEGKFLCKDATGQDLNGGAQPKCATSSPGSTECPANEEGTEGKDCKTAGLICNYPGPSCPEGTTENNICQCMGKQTADGGVKLSYVCEKASCRPRVDAGPVTPTACHNRATLGTAAVTQSTVTTTAPNLTPASNLPGDGTWVIIEDKTYSAGSDNPNVGSIQGGYVIAGAKWEVAISGQEKAILNAQKQGEAINLTYECPVGTPAFSYSRFALASGVLTLQQNTGTGVRHLKLEKQP